MHSMDFIHHQTKRSVNKQETPRIVASLVMIVRIMLKDGKMEYV